MATDQPSEVFCAGDDHWFYDDADACACGAVASAAGGEDQP